METLPNRKELAARVREIPLPERLTKCQSMIWRMCAKGRPPAMTIPLQWDDEDFFIIETLKDAYDAIKEHNESDADKLHECATEVG